MATKEVQEKRVDTIENFILERCNLGSPPTIDEIIEKLDEEKLLEELNKGPFLDDKDLLVKKQNVFRNILKNNQNIKCNRSGNPKPTYYLIKQKRLTDKAIRLKSILKNFGISEPLRLGIPILPDFENDGTSNNLRPCGVYFIHKNTTKPEETIKYHLDMLIYRLKINFKANAVFTNLDYLDIQLIGKKGCLLTLPTTDTAIECYNRLSGLINDSEEVPKEEDS